MDEKCLNLTNTWHNIHKSFLGGVDNHLMPCVGKDKYFNGDWYKPSKIT